MTILITLALVDLYCIACLVEGIYGSAESEPKWNIFHVIAHHFETKE